MSFELYAAYLVACFVIVIVPGPTVTLIVANSLIGGVVFLASGSRLPSLR